MYLASVQNSWYQTLGSTTSVSRVNPGHHSAIKHSWLLSSQSLIAEISGCCRNHIKHHQILSLRAAVCQNCLWDSSIASEKSYLTLNETDWLVFYPPPSRNMLPSDEVLWTRYLYVLTTSVCGDVAKEIRMLFISIRNVSNSLHTVPTQNKQQATIADNTEKHLSSCEIENTGCFFILWLFLSHSQDNNNNNNRFMFRWNSVQTVEEILKQADQNIISGLKNFNRR